MLKIGLNRWNSGQSLAAEHDNGLAGLIFGSRADLIAGQIEADAISLIGRRKMQRAPINYDLSAAHAEKTAEIDHSSTHLPALVDKDIDDTTQVLPGTAADLLAERTLNVLRVQNRLPGVLAVLGVPGCGRCRPGSMDVLGQGSRRGQRANARRED